LVDLIQGLLSAGEDLPRISTHEPIVAFLVVNKIKELPNLSIQSALANTSASIVVGYFSDEDIVDIQPHPRLYRLKLNNDEDSSQNTNTVYSDFGKLEFFYLVTFKWILLQKLFGLGFKILIYSDLDIAWFKDAVAEITLLFNDLPNVHVAIQSATLIPSQPRLCMGFAAFRRSEEVDELIRVCHLNHLSAVKNSQMIGDDDVVTTYYTSDPKPNWILELPQVSFPVGILMNAFVRNRTIPGLNLPLPFIFHANYVVGERNKRLLMQYAMHRIFLESKFATFSLEMRIFLLLKRLRFLASVIKKALIVARFKH
jgi:hypothetical protein